MDSSGKDVSFFLNRPLRVVSVFVLVERALMHSLPVVRISLFGLRAHQQAVSFSSFVSLLLGACSDQVAQDFFKVMLSSFHGMGIVHFHF